VPITSRASIRLIAAMDRTIVLMVVMSATVVSYVLINNNGVRLVKYLPSAASVYIRSIH